jgi:hypothetical protein
MLRTQVQIEEDQMVWLRAKAKAKGVSVSQLIREGIHFYRIHEERFPENRKRKALDAVGRFASRASDVSVRHDDYLAEAYGEEDHNGN